MGKRPSNAPLSEREIEVIRKQYPKVGASAVARKLRRSPSTIHVWVRRLGLPLYRDSFYDVTTKLVPIRDVADCAGCAERTVADVGQRAGVLRRRSRGGCVAYNVCVPEKWADAFIADRRARKQAEALEGIWYSTAKVAELLGVSVKQIHNALAGRPPRYLAPYLSPIERIRTTRNRWLWNPRQVEEVRRRYRQERRAA